MHTVSAYLDLVDRSLSLVELWRIDEVSLYSTSVLWGDVMAVNCR